MVNFYKTRFIKYTFFLIINKILNDVHIYHTYMYDYNIWGGYLSILQLLWFLSIIKSSYYRYRYIDNVFKCISFYLLKQLREPFHIHTLNHHWFQK